MRNDSCIFQIEVSVNYELYSVFMSYGPGVKIISPKWAKDHMTELLEEMLEAYKLNYKGRKSSSEVTLPSK
jgi:predicted DNA-binding transcriptional regulator YafY